MYTIKHEEYYVVNRNSRALFSGVEGWTKYIQQARKFETEVKTLNTIKRNRQQKVFPMTFWNNAIVEKIKE